MKNKKAVKQRDRTLTVIAGEQMSSGNERDIDPCLRIIEKKKVLTDPGAIDLLTIVNMLLTAIIPPDINNTRLQYNFITPNRNNPIRVSTYSDNKQVLCSQNMTLITS